MDGVPLHVSAADLEGTRAERGRVRTAIYSECLIRRTTSGFDLGAGGGGVQDALLYVFTIIHKSYFQGNKGGSSQLASPLEVIANQFSVGPLVESNRKANPGGPQPEGGSRQFFNCTILVYNPHPVL